METKIKKIKYLYLIPFLISLRKVILGNKNKDIENLLPDNNLFFIMGSGRNGSTLLGLLLGRHKKIFLPPEQSVLPYSIMSWHLIPFIKWKRFCEKIINNYQYRNQNWNLSKKDFSNIKEISIGLNKKYRKASNIFRLVFKSYAEKISHDKIILGDQTPNTTLFYKSIYNEFPKAKYIFLLRNPLDVILSYSKMPKNPAANPTYASWKWNTSIEAYNWLKKKSDSSVLLVKYENLVTDPEKITKQIFDFLGVENQSVIIPEADDQENDPLGAKNYTFHTNLYKPINGKSINKWKENLDLKTIKKVYPLIKDNAKDFNYSIRE